MTVRSWVVVMMVTFLFLYEAAQEFEDADGGGGVEFAGGLVGEDEFGAVGQGASDRDALLFAAREFVWAVVGSAGEADHLHEFVGAAPAARKPAPAMRSAISTFSAAESRGKSPKDWKTKPILWRRRLVSWRSLYLVMSSPSILTMRKWACRGRR